jgi:hypothetical protein
MSKYDPLKLFLQRQSASSVTMNFDKIDRIVALPSSAKKYEWWWANENPHETSHVQCLSWQYAGYDAFPNIQTAQVKFVRERGGLR